MGDADIELEAGEPLILRRTYLSGYQVQREFGIGASHDGERFVSGELDDLSSVSLVNADESRVVFERISFGTDTRIAPLLLGCALGMCTTWWGGRATPAARMAFRVVG